MQKIIAILIFTGLSQYGCTSSGLFNNDAPAPMTSIAPQQKAGSKVVDDDAETKMFLKRALMSKLTARNQLTVDDEKLLSEIGKTPARGSIDEALVIMHYATAGNVPSPESEKKTEDDTPSFEDQLASRGISIESAVTLNPHLQSPARFSILLKASRESKNSPDFRSLVFQTVKSQAEVWGKFADAELQFDAVTDTLSEAVSAVPNEELPAATALSAADLRNNDSILVEAQSLADQGKYLSAIHKVRRIPDSSPMHASAQEKLKQFSNMAVRDLRSKAARAFQSSLPVADPKAKLAYLDNAKRFLEQALTQFPEAEQLSTVKQNLAVISRDLEKLQNRVEEDKARTERAKNPKKS